MQNLVVKKSKKYYNYKNYSKRCIKVFFKENDVVLFQGDSVTDCGRNRDNLYDLGVGYPLIISSLLGHKLSHLNMKFINKGISGNRSIDLVNRWQEDCVDLKPTVVSILIGINDTWRKFDSNDATSTEEFEANYRKILDDVKKLGARIVLMEPFVHPYPDDRKAWREDLDPKIQVVRQLAKEYGAVLVPTDGIVNAGFVAVPEKYYSEDGVHPTYAGHGLLAEAWCKAVGINI